MRHTVPLWANGFRKSSAWGQTYYEQKRQSGMSHACALRCLGQRLLKILFRMLVEKKPTTPNGMRSVRKTWLLGPDLSGKTHFLSR
jgi:hypothetical protein